MGWSWCIPPFKRAVEVAVCDDDGYGRVNDLETETVLQE